jgi:putative solute:sodium symporter small subunit
MPHFPPHDGLAGMTDEKGTRHMLIGGKNSASIAMMAPGPVMATLRWTIAVLLPVWLVYFFAVTLFAKTLNAIMVPHVDVPLGNLMVVQGAVLAFVAILVPLIRAFSTRAAQ